MRIFSPMAILVILILAPAWANEPPELELLSVTKIWDEAPHNAFTDLLRWNGQFYCAFREGRGHVSTDGRIRVLASEGGNSWESVALIDMEGYDLRDAHLCATPGRRMMLLGGAAPRKEDGQGCATGSFVAFSANGRTWTEPTIVVEPGRWLWQVDWFGGKAYGFAYGTGGRAYDGQLLVTDDGLNFDVFVPGISVDGRFTEATVRFASDGTCYALIRRERRGDNPTGALLGVARADYAKWELYDLGLQFRSFGGPNLMQLPFGDWIAAGRMHQGGAHTAVTWLEMNARRMEKLLKLPSGGDTSYPGLAWYDDVLWVSYYSSHEGKTSIYMARIAVHVPCPACGGDLTTVPMLVGLPSESMHDQMRRGEALLAGCIGNPYNPKIACVCPKCRKWKTEDMKHWQDLPRAFGRGVKVD